MFGLGVGRFIAKLLGKPPSVLAHNIPTNFFYAETDASKSNSAEDRFWMIRECADLRSTDHVLDVGCAEGVITLEVATRVQQVCGIDYASVRIAQAEKMAREKGISNAQFRVEDLHDSQFDALSYDVVFFMSVYNILTKRGRIGPEQLRAIACAARRQLIMRMNVQDCPQGDGLLAEVYHVLDEEGFDCVCFPRDGKYDNVLIANRRGSDARLHATHQLILIPVEYASRVAPQVSGLPKLPWHVHGPA